MSDIDIAVDPLEVNNQKSNNVRWSPTGADGDADPLGLRDTVVHLDSLTRWNLTLLPLATDTDDDNPTVAENEKGSPFPWRNDLNNKIVLWLVQ
jgi:hypothetical protein